MKNPLKRIATFLIAAVALTACGGSSELRVAPLEYQFRELPNGMRVYAMPDASTANVSVQVWYDVGATSDPVGRSGFAHLFEHIMFKSTRNMPSETFDRLTEDVGGFNNASTWDDFTNYYEVVPANHLQRILWAEAERLGSLVVDPEVFESERDVVKEELRQGILASPYGRLFGLYISQANFSVHPYGRPVIGSIEDLDAATVDDVRAFHATYYRPDNAVLVVAGNFDPEQFDAWVDQYFAPIARPDRPIPRVEAVEPVRTGPREFTTYAPNVPLPAVLVSYPQPQSTSEDFPALMVLDAILARGDSSRLYQSMVYDQQLAAQVLTDLEAKQDPAAYSLGAILSEGRTADEGLASLSAEIARVRDELVTDAELDEAKNEIVTATLQGRETAFGRAYELAEAVIRYGDAAYADRLLQAIQATTAEDIQRVARAVLDDNRRVAIRYLPEESRPQGQTGDLIATSSTIAAPVMNVAASDVPVTALALEAERQRPPEPAAAVAARIPETAERTLDNGLRVIVATNRNLPLISAEVRVAYGSSADPADRAGLANMTADLLMRGTATRGATEIARQVESLGAALTTGAGADSSASSLQTRSDRAEEAFAVFADVTRNPAFAQEELDRARQQALDGLSVQLSQPGGIATRAMARAMYGTAPYGATASERSYGAITRDDASGYHARHWRPDAAVLVISGDVTAREGFQLAERHFGDWARPEGERPVTPDASANAPAPRTIVVDLPQSGQAAVYFGMHGPSRTDPGYLPALLATDVLGGGYSARLNAEIRIVRGLSYGAGAGFPARMSPAPIIANAQTRNDAAVQVVELMQAELNRMRTTPVPEGELTARKAVLIGDFGRAVETTAGLAGEISALALFGLPPERLNSYATDINAITAEQVRRSAERLYDPARADLVVVGDARLFWDQLRRRRPSAERIPVTELNLDSEALR